MWRVAGSVVPGMSRDRSVFIFWINRSFFHWHYSPLWALACRTMSFHFFLSATNSLHLLTPSTWRSLSTSSFYLSPGLPLLLVPSSSWVTIFLGTMSSSTLSRWPNQLILCPFFRFTIVSPLLISSSSRFIRLFHSPFSYLGPYRINHSTLLKLHGPVDEATTILRTAGICPPSDTQPHML